MSALAPSIPVGASGSPSAAERSKRGGARLVSFVLPVCDEVSNLRELHRNVTEVMNRLPDAHEIIFVDDGSTDGSFEVMCEIQSNDPRVRVIQLRRNFGKSAAYRAGFDHSRGDIVITMDADLQDDPRDIPKFIARLDEGFDMVNGWKHEGKGPMTRSIPSRVFNRVIARVTGIKLHDFNCPFKAYRREVLEELDLRGDLHRFIPVLAHAKGFTIAEIKINNLPRQYGRSKYGFARFPAGLFDTFTILFLTRFGQRPLHILGLGGMLISGLGLLILLFLAGAHVLYLSGVLTHEGWNIHDRPILSLGILLIIVGTQFFSMGLLGELFVTGVGSQQRNTGYSVAKIVETEPSSVETEGLAYGERRRRT